MPGAIKKVLIVTNIPNPYRIPLFNELSKQLTEYEIGLKVIFGARAYSHRKFELNPDEFKFDFELLTSKTFHFGNNENTFFTYSGLLNKVNTFNPDKIIIIGFSIGTLKLWVRSFFKKTNYIIWSGSILKKGRNDSFLRKIQRKFLIKRASGFVAYGTKAKEYLISCGAPGEKISIGINTVDTIFFANETEKIRNRNNPAEVKRLLYIGYLTPRKNVLKLIQIVELLAKSRFDFVLDIIGDGIQKNELEIYVKEKGLGNIILFHGFIQKNELPKYLSKSTIFLFQTDFDIWGLVLNEAMAAGISTIASVNAGASFDLIKEGENGYIVDFDNIQEVINKINNLLDNPALTKKMGKQAAFFIAEHASIKKSAKGFIHAILKF